jgi:signal peptide peptidase SppA
MTALSGATSLETFTSDLRELVADDRVKQVVIDIDSPGGVADMIPETGTLIKELSAVKPIYAIANTMAGSAAFWLLAQATKAYGTPSGKVGSHGVYTVHQDQSAANEKLGIKTTYIYAGKYKVAGNPDEKLSADAREYIQESVDEAYDMFTEALADGRGKTTEYVLKNFGQGRMFRSEKAAKVGMIDGVMSMDQLLTTLVTENMKPGNTKLKTQTELARITQLALTTTGGTNLSDPQAFSEPGDIQPNDDLNPDDSFPDRYDTRPADEDGTTPRRSDTVTGAPQHTNDNKGGEEMDDAQLKALMDKLGLESSGDSAKDHAAALAAIDGLNSEITPLRQLKADAQKNVEFSQAYPEQAARMARLEKRDRLASAREFASKFQDVSLARVVGDDDKVTSLGFSANVLTDIENLCIAFSENNASLEMFSSFLESLTTKGLVDYGNVGSTRPDERGVDVPTEPAQIRAAFAEKMAEIMRDDKLDADAALKAAATKYPELYAAYLKPVRA